ncbi:serine/threonine-protein kinase [Paraliomyxa miuraensis]|uniref:serine/threonine-protein kinase n=1 Tax=Paraliomyxa miuraensis TaxID=376150 RepID=UPI0022571846|nr:serine/threonine-protein kinase [Paraliomyxa miuraensis]MCX4240491.1 tetratricopeptide repeat protein [Paraliomyxa miuraensis]
MSSRGTASATRPLDTPPTVLEAIDDGASALEVSAGLGQGAIVGDRYVVLGKIAAGGMGIVYSAYDPELDRKVALKVLRVREHGDRDAVHGEQLRLVRESRSMAKLSHPNVVAVHDVGISDGIVFMAMDLVEGRTLRTWLGERTRSWQEVVAVMLDAGAGLAAAHRAGLVHRDFKPGNVLISDQGRVFVTDFGLARATHVDDPDVEDGSASSSQSSASFGIIDSVTACGTVLGTPGYMAPEQVVDETIDARTDQFAFCVTLHRALYGALPFDCGNPPRHPALWRRRELRPETRVPHWLARVIARGLELRPEDRHPSMEVLFERLRADPARAWKRRGAALAVAATLGGSAWAYARAVEPPDVCSAGDPRVDDVWGESRREQVRAAFTSVARPYADAAWTHADTVLGRFTDEWEATRKQACEATHVRHEHSPEMLDRRMWCLEQALDTGAAISALLAEADAELVLRSSQTLAGLPRPSSCYDIAPSQSGLAPPEDPQVRAVVARLRKSLAEGTALELAGRLAEGIERVDQVIDEASDISHDSTLAEAHLLLGRLHSGGNDGKQADAELRLALRHAERARRDDLRVDILQFGAQNAANVEGNPERGRLWHDLAGSALERLEGDQEQRRAIDALVHGAMAHHEGDTAAAMALMSEALELQRGRPGTEYVVAAGEHNIGIMLSDLGRHREAIERMEHSIAAMEAVTGPMHPQMGYMHINVASSHLDLGQHERAIEAYGRAVEAFATSMGDAHPTTSHARQQLAFAMYRGARLEGAESVLDRAARDLETALGPDEPMPQIHYTRGWIQLAEGRFEDALESFSRAHAAAQRATNHSLTAGATGGMGEALVGLGRHAEGIERLQEAVSLSESTTPGSSNMGYLLFGLGTAHLRAGQPDAAVPLLERSLALMEPKIDDAIMLGRARASLAEALSLDPTRRREAMELARMARRELDDAGARARRDLVHAFDWLDSHTNPKASRGTRAPAAKANAMPAPKATPAAGD